MVWCWLCMGSIGSTMDTIYPSDRCLWRKDRGSSWDDASRTPEICWALSKKCHRSPSDKHMKLVVAWGDLEATKKCQKWSSKCKCLIETTEWLVVYWAKGAWVQVDGTWTLKINHVPSLVSWAFFSLYIVMVLNQLQLTLNGNTVEGYKDKIICTGARITDQLIVQIHHMD
jgi:hypothetical protein